MTLVPQRGVYDLLPLLAIPDNKRKLLLSLGFSWLLYFLVFGGKINFPFRFLSVLLFYLPILFINFPVIGVIK